MEKERNQGKRKGKEKEKDNRGYIKLLF